MLTEPEIRALAGQEISDLLGEDAPGARALDGSESLHELGLSSLLLARLIIKLELEVGADPFEEDVAIADVRTVNDLVRAYAEASGAAPRVVA